VVAEARELLMELLERQEWCAASAMMRQGDFGRLSTILLVDLQRKTVATGPKIAAGLDTQADSNAPFRALSRKPLRVTQPTGWLRSSCRP
jgi:hypothetical protein